MKFSKFLFGVLGLAVATFGCTPEPPQGNEPEQPQLPKEEFARLTLFSGCGHNAASDDSELTRTAVWSDAVGSGSLSFKWESVSVDSELADGLSLIISDGQNPIYGKSESNPDSLYYELSYSGLAVTPHEGDAQHATFQTVQYYSAEEMQNASYCYAVAGDAEMSEDVENSKHICNLDMPSTFTQTASQEPGYLRDYMYMYANTAYKENQTILNFRHIPATFRFVVTNSTSHDITLWETSVSVADQEDAFVASSAANLAFDWTDGSAEVSFEEDGHSRVTVEAGADGATLAAGEAFTAYALALPLADNDSFKSKTLNFCVKSDTLEQVAFQLKDTELAALNGSETYNWVSGKSYTVRIYIKEEGKATGEILEGNRIEVTPGVSGTYLLMYEGADGKPLEEYATICRLPIKEIGSYEDFIDVNVAPREAQQIGIYNTAGERQGTINLSNFKPDFSATPLYSFGLLSDVHIGRESINPESDFKKALNFFKAKDVVMTCICGDITQDGTEAQFQKYQEIVIEAETPVYTTTGNHDCMYSGINAAVWEKYTDRPLVFEETVERNGKTDHYLFLGMSVWNFSAAYLPTSLAWLEEKLEEYRNERCFVITHLFFPDRAGNLNRIYPSGNWLSGIQLKRLQDMCDRYVNTIWFSGHSHWEWQLQKYQDIANIYRTYEADVPTSGWCVHVPSCGVPITSNGSSRVDNASGSEGAVVQVYDNHIDILGIDLKSGKYLPIATYRLDTSILELEAKEEEKEDETPVQNLYLKASDFVWNPEKVSGATVKDVEGMPNYVEVTFTAKGQGFYTTNSTFSSDVTSVSITVEDVQAFSNGEQVDVPANVGFYGGSDYYLTTTDNAKIYQNQGVQFQTSNSKYGNGPLPLTLRMKVKMEFK